VRLTIASGLFNSTTNRLRFDANSGFYRFTALNNTSFSLVYTVELVQVQGDQNNDLRAVLSGALITVNAGNNVLINWYTPLEPALPFLFILGVVGLMSMFAGPLYAIQKSKEKKYREGFVTGLTITVLGIALVLSWLYG